MGKIVPLVLKTQQQNSLLMEIKGQVLKQHVLLRRLSVNKEKVVALPMRLAIIFSEKLLGKVLLEKWNSEHMC